VSGGGKSKAVTVGYRYYLGLHFALSQGPIDALLEVQVGERTAWSGTQSSSGSISIDAPDLFGGDTREGGIQGTLDVMMGESTQAANAYLTAQQGSPQPGYRGILSVVYEGGLIAANNPYVKNWAFRIRRILSGWTGTAWYTAKASIDLGSGILAMNPAHIIYQCLSDPRWGLGYSTSLIDSTSFTAAADTFYSEGLGLCLMWSQQDSLINFVQMVMDHCGAVLSEDPTTGLFKLRPLRLDYTIGSLPEYSDTSGTVIEVQRVERSSLTETLNELTVQYVDQATGKDGSITVQNLANVQAQGAVVAETRQYPGLPTAALAARVAMRDLKAATAGLARVQMVVTREAFALVPGDVIRFTWAPLGLDQMALRIVRIDYGTLAQGGITIEGIEDVFGLPSTAYVAAPPIGWVEPNYTPVAPTIYLAQESTYRDVYAALGQSDAEVLPASSGYLVAAAVRPATGYSTNYGLDTRAGSDAYVRTALQDWAPGGLLSSGISKTDTSLVLSSPQDLDLVEVGTLAIIGTGTTAEYVEVTAVNVGTATLTVARGCVDTVPHAWSSSTPVCCLDLFAATDGVEYIATEVISARFRTLTPAGELATGSSPVATVTANYRAHRPYPPGQFQINASYYPSTAGPSAAVSWAHRDRKLQGDQIFDTTDAGVGPEAGMTYRLRFIDDDTSTVLDDVSGLTGTTYQYQSSFSGNLKIELRSVRDGYDSWQLHDHVLVYTGVNLPWTPADISTSIWFDADDANSITLSGSSVVQWNDKSGNGIHADGGFTNKPTVAASSLGGRSTLAFGGSAALRLVNQSTLGINPTGAGNLFRNKAGASFAVLYRVNPADTSATSRWAFNWSNGTTPNNTRVGIRTYTSGYAYNGAVLARRRLDGDSALFEGDATNHGNAWLIVTAYVDFSGQAGKIFVDGTLVEAPTSWGTSGNTSDTQSQNATIGAFVSSGSSISEVMRGNIAEIVAFDSVFNDDTRQRLEGYLAHKWSLTASLPSDHPWKVIPPTPGIGGWVGYTTEAATCAADGTVT
jgi:hypothetical protein